MGWIQVLVAALGSLLAFLLVRDFLAGLGEERIWSDPRSEDTSDHSNQHRGLAPVIPILKEDRVDDIRSFTDKSDENIRGRLA